MKTQITPDEYQALADRTRCSMEPVLTRISRVHDVLTEQGHKNIPSDAGQMVVHAIIGLTGEVGELTATLERYTYYGQPFDRSNLIEEGGDVLWYLAELFNALGISMKDVMLANLRKLAQRYPEKFDEVLALEENRDRVAELLAIEAPKS